jgi:hypothetical protein
MDLKLIGLDDMDPINLIQNRVWQPITSSVSIIWMPQKTDNFLYI